MGHFDLLCMWFSLVSRAVASEEDRGVGACSSAQSWAVTQPQSERCCNYSFCNYLSERCSHELEAARDAGDAATTRDANDRWRWTLKKQTFLDMIQCWVGFLAARLAADSVLR